MFLICFLVILTLETSVKCATGGGNGNENDPEDLSDRLQELKRPSDEQNTARSSARRQRRHNIRQSSAAASSTPEVPSQMDESGAPTEVQHDLRRAGQLSLQSRLDGLSGAEQTPKKHQKKSRNMKKRQVEAAKVGAKRSTTVTSSEPPELLPGEAALLPEETAPEILPEETALEIFPEETASEILPEETAAFAEDRSPTGSTTEPADPQAHLFAAQATSSQSLPRQQQSYAAASAQCEAAGSVIDRFNENVNSGLAAQLLHFDQQRKILQQNFVRQRDNIKSAKKQKNRDNKVSQILKSFQLLSAIYDRAKHIATSVEEFKDVIQNAKNVLKERPPTDDNVRLHFPLDEHTHTELVARAVVDFITVTDVDQINHEFIEFINTDLLSELQDCNIFFEKESSLGNLEELNASFRKQLKRSFKGYTVTSEYEIYDDTSTFTLNDLLNIELITRSLCDATNKLIALAPEKDASDIAFQRDLKTLKRIMETYIEETETTIKGGTIYLNSASSAMEAAERIGYFAVDHVLAVGYLANDMWNVNKMKNTMKEQIGRINAYLADISRRAITQQFGKPKQTYQTKYGRGKRQ